MVFLGDTIKWPMLAQALGIQGMQAVDPRFLTQQMKEWLETPGPALLEVKISQTENCYPMIPAGAAARDMIG